jgi:hypothetical protein
MIKRTAGQACSLFIKMPRKNDMKSEQKTSYDVEGFEAFRVRAMDKSLSSSEKIGFPDAYRQGKAAIILEDIISKLSPLRQRGKKVLDVGAGCSDLPIALMEYCADHDHSLVLVDSEEMLSPLPVISAASKIVGSFPSCIKAITSVHERYDAILVYSVAQYVFVEASLWGFIDSLVELLAEGGCLLIGDIPNVSKRKRFLVSEQGRAFHAEHFDPVHPPRVDFNQLERGLMDDAVVLSVVARMRAAGLDAYIVPQAPDLPMANRREDILICRP